MRMCLNLGGSTPSSYFSSLFFQKKSGLSKRQKLSICALYCVLLYIYFFWRRDTISLRDVGEFVVLSTSTIPSYSGFDPHSVLEMRPEWLERRERGI